MKTVILEFTEEEISTLHDMIVGSLITASKNLEKTTVMAKIMVEVLGVSKEDPMKVIEHQIEVGLEIQKKICFVTHSDSETDHKAM